MKVTTAYNSQGPVQIKPQGQHYLVEYTGYYNEPLCSYQYSTALMYTTHSMNTLMCLFLHFHNGAIVVQDDMQNS